MSKRSAKKLDKLLKKVDLAEQTLLIKRNKNLAHNLKTYIKCKQKIADYEIDG